MSAFFVVNPRSANGRTGREWEDIRADIDDLFPNFKFALTRGRADAVRLTRQALCDGHDEVIAVGGDGTINETINGFFELERQINPDASFGFITSGTGGDFRKSFSIDQGVRAGLARLAGARLRSIDVGRLSCLNEKHVTVKRHFINISSFGLPGVVVDAINRARIAKLFGGRFAFAFHSLRSMLFFRARAVRLILDNGFDEIVPVSTVAVANGQYFGGGMRIAPNAVPDDGLFDIVVIAESKKTGTAAGLKQIYSGEHLNNPAVRVFRSRKLTAAPIAQKGSKPVRVEADGESAGLLPATFEILPGALRVKC